MSTLVIHSGGDSKRVPQYSALGKLFSPVPHELPNGRVSSLFDEFLIATAGIPSRIRGGMLLLSGDVLLLFNPLQVDFSGVGAAALSFKEHVKTGARHGVYMQGENGNVARFLHKYSESALRAQGVVNEKDCVDIDTGAVIFSPEILRALYGLIQEGDDSFRKYVNDTVRLSLYGDFLYPLATESTLEQFYQEKPEGALCEALLQARKAVWEALRPFRMKLLRFAPAKFIHFGTTSEIMRLMSDEIEAYRHIGWAKHVNSSIRRSDVAGYNSVLSDQAKCGKNVYLEVSYVHHGATVGNNVLLSYVDVYNAVIPDNVVLHGLKQRDGRFVVRIYGIDDNPKQTIEIGCTFLGHPLSAFLEQNGLAASDLWQGDDHSLWEAELYPSCATIDEALSAALNVYAMAQGHGDVQAWRMSERKSLRSGFNDADPEALIAWDKRMQELVRMDRMAKMIRQRNPPVKLLQCCKR